MIGRRIRSDSPRSGRRSESPILRFTGGAVGRVINVLIGGRAYSDLEDAIDEFRWGIRAAMSGAKTIAPPTACP